VRFFPKETSIVGAAAQEPAPILFLQITAVSSRAGVGNSRHYSTTLESPESSFAVFFPSSASLHQAFAFSFVSS